MEPVFNIAAVVAVISTVLMLTRLNIVHALLYLVVSLLSVAVVFMTLGAAFVAALEVIVYAGAIMVLFVFVVMMLNLGRHGIHVEKRWLTPDIWAGPVALAAVLLVEVIRIAKAGTAPLGTGPIEPKAVAIALFGPYLIGVELASMLLLAGLVGAYHLGSRDIAARGEKRETHNDTHSDERRLAAGGDLVLAGADQSSRTP